MGFQGKSLWACTEAGVVQSLDSASLRPSASWKLPGIAQSVTAAAFSGETTLLAVGDSAGHVILSRATGEPIRQWQADQFQVSALAWSPDHRQVAVGLVDGTVKLCLAADGSLVHRWPAFPLEVESVLFDPDCRWLIAGMRMGDGEELGRCNRPSGSDVRRWGPLDVV